MRVIWITALVRLGYQGRRIVKRGGWDCAKNLNLQLHQIVSRCRVIGDS